MNDNEKPLFFSNGNYQLFGVLHYPLNDNLKGGFVFCHAFAEEKLWTHRVFVSFARELAKEGYAVLRFDHYGHGDSQGDFKEATIEHYKSDIAASIDFIKNKVPELKKVSLLGQRFGATLAAIITESREDIDKLILWDPILDGSRYMQEMLRINLTTQLAVYGKVTVMRDALVESMKQGNTVNIDGYEMSLKMYEQASSLNLKDSKKFNGACLIVQMSKKEQAIKKGLNDLLNSYSNGNIELAIELPYWREIKESYFRAPDLYARTLNWLRTANE